MLSLPLFASILLLASVKFLVVGSHEVKAAGTEEVEADLKTGNIQNALNGGGAVRGRGEGERAVSRRRLTSDASSDGNVRRLTPRSEKEEGPGQASLEALVLFDRDLGSSFSTTPAPTATAAPTASRSPSSAPSAGPTAAPTAFLPTPGSTAGAPSPKNNPECSSDCTNGCPSRWYKVTGTGEALTASTCRFTNYDSRILIWKGPCEALVCVGSNDDACGSTSSQFTWASEAGATYFIQVTGYSGVNFGDYKLSVRGVAEPPVEVDACCSTAYFSYDPKTDFQTGRFYNGSTVCLGQPYNIQVDACDVPASDPLVRLKLADADCAIVHRQNELEAPYFLWGNKGEDVFRNNKLLPNGGYYLYSKEGGVTERIQFTQSCPGKGPGKPFGKVCGTKF